MDEWSLTLTTENTITEIQTNPDKIVINNEGIRKTAELNIDKKEEMIELTINQEEQKTELKDNQERTDIQVMKINIDQSHTVKNHHDHIP